MTRAESLFDLGRRLGRPPARLRPAAGPLFAVAVCAALGLALPLGSPPSATGPEMPTMVTATGSADVEALDGFLAMTRWGWPGVMATKEDDDDSAGEEATSGLNPELARLGVIGITGVAGRRAVRLTRPDGDTVRLRDGDALPDGRILIAVTGNALTLETADGHREELLLFPRLDDAVNPDEPPGDEPDVP